MDSEEVEEGVNWRAAPVFGPDAKILAAMSISGPAGRLSEAHLEKLVPRIKKIADSFSESLDDWARHRLDPAVENGTARLRFSCSENILSGT